MGIRIAVIILWALSALVPSAHNVHAQATQSSITGTITDPSGAPVPKAVVSVRNQGTNFALNAGTDHSGDYRVTGLETGTYEVSVASPGFRKHLQTQVDVAGSQIKRVDAALQLGEVTNTVTVEGAAGQVETETVILSNVKTNRDFAQLPLSPFGRGYYGNSARTILTGPGSSNWNTAVHKNWRFGAERAQLQFRWEMFNAFNRVNFSSPNANIQSGSFGLVTTAGAGRSMLFGLRLEY